ncbi:hypothetical protein C8J56DRAFT_1037706 [Mycena floridula]|nr:hypothetical protein C8J56DRAFT_1037706 [Mycena floridula]
MSFTTPVDDIGTTNQAYESEPDNPLNVRRKTATAAHYNSPAETLSDLQTSDSDLTHSPNFRNHPVKISSDIDDEATTRRRQRSRSRGGYHDRTPEMMPLPPNKGAPKKFRGDYAYVRKFLKQYVQLCRAYNVTSEQEKCEKLLDYVGSRVGKFIESNSNYIHKDWDELEKDLLHYYDAERVDTRYALKDLVLLTDKWAKKDMSDLATYKRYSIEFHTIAGWLVMKDMLTIRHRDGHFFRGIKRGLREKLEERYINQNRGATLKDPIPIAAIDKMIENQFNRHSYRDELEDTLTSRKHQSKSRRDRDYDSDSDSDDSGSEQAPGNESDTEDSDEEDSNDGRQNKRHIREGKKKSTKRKHSKSRRDEDNNSDREDPSKSSHHSKKPHKTYDESEDEEDDSKHNKSSRHSRKNHKAYDSARDVDDRKGKSASDLKKSHKMDATDIADLVERLVKERLAEEDQKATRGRTRSDSVPDTASSKSKSNKRVPDAAELDALIDKMRTMEITDPRYQGLYMQAYLINPVIAKIVKQPPNPNEVPQQPRRNMFNGGGPRQYQTMQVAQQTPAVQSVQTGPPLTGPNLIPVAGNGYQGAPATMQSFQEEGCFGCGLGGHMLRNCQRVNDLIMEGLVTRDELGRLRYLNGNLVRRINGLYLADSVVRTINSQAPALSTFLAEIDEASNRTMQVNWAGESYPAQVYAKTDKQAGTGREAREKVNDRSRAPPNSTSAIGREIRAENRPIQGHVHQPQPVKVVPKPVSPDNAMTQRPAYRSENPVPVPREGLQTRGLKPALVPMDKTAGQSPQRAEPRPPADPVPEPIPFDARKTRFVPTDDVVMKEVNNGHVSSNEARKRNPQQSELQRRVDVKALMRKILKTPIAVTMEEYLGTSREMAEEVTKLLRFKNAKSLTDDEAVLLTALQAEMYYPEQEDYYGDDESDDSDYPDISNPTSNIAMSREMTLPEGRDRAPLITIMFECQGKPINAILDSGSMLNIVREDVFAASIRYPKKAEERITMRDANGNDGELVGLSRSVRLDIGTISTRANLHIGSTTLPYQMLLGRPYMLDNKVSIDERDEGTFVIFEPDGQDRWELFTNPAKLMRVHTVDTQNGPVTYRNIYHQEAADYARSTGYGGCYAVLDAIVPGSPKMLQDDFIHTMEPEAPETRKVQTPDDSERQELSDESGDSQTSDGESESETDEENDDHSLPNKDENTARCSTPTREPSSWILSEHWQEEWPEAAEGTLPNTVETLQYLKSRLHKMAMKINNEWHAAPRLRSISVKTQQDGTAFSVEWGTEWRIYKIGEIYAMRSDLIELMKQARTQEFEAFHLNEMDSEYSTSSLGDELWTWKLKNYSKLEPRAYKTVDFNEAVTQNNESIQSRMLHGRLSISAENNKLYFGGKMDVANHFRAQIGRIAHQMQHVWNFDHPDRQIHIWTTKDHTEIGVVIEVSKEEPTTEESIARDNKELQYLITDACHDVFANDLAQEGKETYNAETGELEFKWRPKLEVYDNSEPPLHDKIAQWMGKKSWVTDCWEDLVETAMSRTQITGEAPALSENGYADTTKIEPPLIFWDERHYFGIYQDDEIYLIPEGRFGLVIAEEFHEEMMDQSIKFLTGVDVMIDGQSVKMDFISQPTKGGFKRMQGRPSYVYDGCTAYLVGRLWGDKLEEILGKEIAMAGQRLGHLLRVNRLAERNATIILSSKPGTDHVLSAKVTDTQKNNDNADFIRDKKENCMEPRLVPRQLPSDPESVQPTTVTEILEEIDELDQFEGLTLNEPKEEPEKAPQTIAPHLVKVDGKISKESCFTAIVVPSMSRNMLRRSAACRLTGWEQGEINDLEEGIEFNGVQIGFCGRTYELKMTLVDDMENDVAIGKDWMDIGAESLKNLKSLLVQSETKQVVLAIKARLTKEEAVMAILRPKDTFSTISQALVKRTRGEERLCSAEFSTTGEYIQIQITYQDETVTIAALIVPTSERGCEVTLGNNWVDQTKRCVIRTVTVTKPEVSIAATSPADGCTVPSPVFMIDLPRLVNQSTSKVDGGLGMDKEKQSKITKQHNGNFKGVADGIWAAPGILSTSWAVSVTIRQQEIERLTAEINEWAQMQGFKLAGLRTQSLPGTIESPSKDMNKILSNATKDPDLTAELRQKIRRLTGVNLFDSESTPDAQFSDKDSDPESYFKGLEQIAPQIIPAAPIASHHFLKVLKDLENYWLQLAQFEALIRAQGYQLIIAKHEGKLNPGFQMEETTKSAETKEIHSRESIVEAPTKTDSLTTEFQAHPPTKLEATEGPEAIQIRLNEENSGSGLAHRVSSEDLGPCVLCPRGFKLGLRKMTASEQAQAESNLET